MPLSQLARGAALLALLLLAAPGRAARAQSATATLGGTVVDQAGAVIPGASVTVSNSATGLQRQNVTDGEGGFAFPLLPPASYTVRVERAGFAPVEIPDAALGAGDHLAYQIQLRVGGVGGYVLVEDAVGVGGAPSAGAALDRRLFENLPLGGRSPLPLLELAPGTVLTRARFSEQGQFSAAGQRANANYFTVDGISANFGVSAGPAPGQAAGGSLPALTALGGMNNLVSVDALQEFRVQTSAYAAEFGRAPGAQVSLTTRSGTNEFHGELFGYFRHEALDAGDWFASSRALPEPDLRQADFGGVVGGPLVKDRAFFFFSYEGLRLTEPRVAITEVPSRALGHFVAPEPLRPFLNAFPIPNRGGLSAGRASLEEFSASFSDAGRFDAAALRLDAIVGERLFVFGRYNRAPSEAVQRGRGYVFGTSGQSLSTLSRTEAETVTLTVGATWSLSAAASSDTRINWSRAGGATSFALDDFGGAVPITAAHFAPPGAPPDPGLQFVVLGGINTSLGLGRGADNLQRQFNLVHHLSVAAAGHQLKFGLDYRRLSPVYDPAGYFQRATFSSAGPPGATPDVRAGIATQVLVSADEGARSPRFTNFSAFAQDAWRPHGRLALTYGVRWELSPPPAERGGNHPLHAARTADPAVLALAPRGQPLWRTTYGNFAPRLGLAFNLSRGAGTVVRAGAGLYYDAGGGPAAQVFGSVQPYVSVRRLSRVRYPLEPAQAAAPPAGQGGLPLDTVYAIGPELALPYSLQWQVTVEQPLGPRQALSASYAAAAGRRLLRQELLPPNEFAREVRAVSNGSSSDYRALQLHFRRRLSAGLQALASYTWARSADDASEDSHVRALRVAPEWSASDFDVRHSASAALSYDVPAPGFLKGAARLRSWARALAGGWSVDAIYRARTATPVQVTFRRALLSGDEFDLLYPSLVPGRPLLVADPAVAGGRRLNREAFSGTLAGPTLGRNALRGFPMWQLDAALRRRFALTERASLQLRAEVFNVFNHPNFGNPVGDLDSRLFGQSIQTLASGLGSGGVNGGMSPLHQVGGPRSVQLAMKLQF